MQPGRHRPLRTPTRRKTRLASHGDSSNSRPGNLMRPRSPLSRWQIGMVASRPMARPYVRRRFVLVIASRQYRVNIWQMVLVLMARDIDSPATGGNSATASD